MADDIKEKLLNSLHQTGYPFQLHAGRQLQAAGFRVSFSRWYKHSAGKHREIDLHALAAASSPGGGFISAALAIECKTTQHRVGLSATRSTQYRSLLAAAPGTGTRRVGLAAEKLGIPIPSLFPPSTPYVESIIAAHTPTAAKGRAPKLGKPVSRPIRPHRIRH